MASDQSPASANLAAKKQAGTWRRLIVMLINVASVLVFVACIAGIWLVRAKADEFDYAIVNILTLVLSFFALMAMLVKLLFWRGATWKIRLVPIGVLLAAAIITPFLVRIDHVSGRLVPVLAFRWSPKPDQVLKKVEIADDAGHADMMTTTEHDFWQFLGPQRDLLVKNVRLDHDWSAHSPKCLWRKRIGAGWSGFTAVNGFAVTMEQRGDDELVTCYAIDTGETWWSHAVQARYETVTGGVGPRATPTLHGGRVYALGATGVLRCLDGATGELLWSDDIPGRYGVTAEQDQNAVAWGRAASPLIVDDLVVVPFGGPAGGPCKSLAAYDKTTGELNWTAGDQQVSYASPVLASLCGQRQIVSVNESNVTGHAIEDGHVLWSFPWPGGSTSQASASQPVVVSDDRVLLSKDYGEGAALLKLTTQEGGRLEANSVWAHRSLLKTKFTNVVVIDGFIYGLSDGILECVELDTGRRRWKDRRKANYGHGQILGVGDVILVQLESGPVAMVAADPQRFQELGRIDALFDQTWNNLCLYGRYLLVRNSVEATCYELPLRHEDG